MKKLLILTTLVMLSTANLGCRGAFSNWFGRGAPCNTCGPNDPYMSAPSANMAPSDGNYMTLPNPN